MNQGPLSAIIQVPATYALILLFALIITYQACIAVYNVYWHPLSRFPGPRAFAWSRLPYAYCHVTGKLAVKFHELHQIYGPIVRTAPNELSFNQPEALERIYGERGTSCPAFRKNYDTFNETRNQISKSVFIAGDSDHARMRKVINQAFSERALRDQEPRIQSHVQTLMKRLDAERQQKGVVDLNEWYNFAAFDIIADAAFGEPFSTLEDPTYRPWINLIGKTWKAITFASAVKSIAPPLFLLRCLIPTGPFLQKEVNKFDLILNRVKERIAVGTDRIDLLSRVIKYNDRKERMTDQEIISNATLFVAAGTETVTTVLSALTYLVTQDARVMTKLATEIRDTFSDEESITVQSVSHLPYLTACIREALRRFPPIPEGLPRVVPPEGEEISGQWVPGGTFVQVSTLAASLSSINFQKPESFIPERWLDGVSDFSTDKKQASQPFSIGSRNCVGQK
ncbi:MAG: hypothetical protein Q9167_005040 [Letrouitia subvulpina]